MPEPVSNNAVVAAEVNGQPYVYSFCGIDSTKIWPGIHLKAWRYDVAANEWQSLPPVPDAAGGKIAAAANLLKGKIYLTGGYHVAANGAETSSAKVHVFDPVANDWLPDAAPLPTPIDDHVQAVWRDSLLFIITGWSNVNNVDDVQVFNPATNEWMAGTPVPNTVDYKVFGASGVIIGDTIFYAGGAKYANNFPPTIFFRKGVIDPANPSHITWSGDTAPQARGYRMAAARSGDRAVWLGGSDKTYNFNGVAYNGSGGVPPLDRITVYTPVTGSFFQTTGVMPPLMDLRGTAQISDEEVILAGGMLAGQKVSGKTWRVQLGNLVVTRQLPDETSAVKVFPNPASDTVRVTAASEFRLKVFDAAGKIVLSMAGRGELQLPVHELAPGVYWVEVSFGDGPLVVRSFVKK